MGIPLNHTWATRPFSILLSLGALLVPGPGSAQEGGRDELRPKASSIDPAAEALYHLRRAAIAETEGDSRALIQNLEAIDLERPERFPWADRAVFLLAKAYLERGDLDRFVALAERVLTWQQESLFTRWIAYQYYLVQAPGASDRLRSLADRWGAVDERRKRAPADSAAGTVIDALAANLFLRESDPEAAHRLVSRLRSVGPSAPLLDLVKAIARAETDRDDDPILRALAKTDTTTALGRDLSGAARLRLATRALEAGESPMGILTYVPHQSRHRSRAEHVMAAYLIDNGDAPRALSLLEELLDRDPSYPGRREVMTILAGHALEAGRTKEAGALYSEADEAWRDTRARLEAMRESSPLDRLFLHWQRSARGSEVLLFDTYPADELAAALVTELLLDLRPSLEERLELGYLPPAPPSTAARVPDALGVPTPAERGRVAETARALRAAVNEVERLEWRIDAARNALEMRRAYLEKGEERAKDERRLLEERARDLGEVIAELALLTEQLGGVRDAAMRRIASRTRRMVERCRAHLVSIDAMQRFHLDRPTHGLGGPAAEGRDRTAADLLAEEQALASELLAYVEHFALRAPRLVADSHDRKWRERLIDRAVRLARLAGERLAWARGIETRIGKDISSLTEEEITALERELAARRVRIGALARAHEESRLAVARAVIDRSFASMMHERHPIDYGLATVAYLDPNRRVEAIERLTGFLDDHAGSPATSEVRFHLADATLLASRDRFESEMRAFMAARGSENADPKAARVPIAETRPALDLYLSILRDDPSYQHRDAVLYNAGMILAEDGDPRGMALLTELTTEHPRSPFLQKAHLTIADIHFDLRRYGDAIPHYERAVVGEEASYAAIALYKLGWSHYGRDAFLQAADAFRRLIDLYASSRPIELNTDLRPEAHDYLVHALVRAGGADAFTRYFARVGDRPYARDLLLHMGQIFRRYSLYAEAIAVDETFLDRHATDPEALAVASRMIDTYERGEQRDEARDARLQLAPAFVPPSAWHEANRDPALRRAGLAFTRDAWERVARHHHFAAREGDRPRENFARARDLYRTLIRHWPDARHRLELLSGECAFQLGDHAGALAAYEIATGADSASVKSQAEWQLVAVTDAWYEGSRPAPAAPGADSLAARVMDRIDAFLEIRPRDEKAADLLWRKGSLAFAHGWHTRATRELAAFVDAHPADRRAPRAAALAADALYEVGAYPDAAAAYGRAHEIARAAGADTLAARIASILPVTNLKVADAIAEDPDGDRRELARRLETIAARWPGFEHAAACQYRAGLAWIEARDTDRALAAMETLIARFPGKTYERDAHLQLIAVNEAAGRRERAADAYLRFAERFPGDEASGDALLRASDLFVEAGRTGDAEFLRLRYLDEHPEDALAAAEILEPLARRDLARVRRGTPIATVRDTTRARSYLSRYLALARVDTSLVAPSIRAETRYHEAEVVRGAYERAALVQPLDTAIEAKQAALEALLAAYGRVTDVAVVEWSEASAFRIGEALVAFGAALESSERPPDLTGDDLLAYQDVLFEQADAFYARGEAVWADLLREARAKGAENGDWVAKARTALWSRLGGKFLHRPEVEYPLVNATPRAPASQLGSANGSEALRLATTAGTR